MDLGLNGKRALVLGASRGLGAAVARTLAVEGATVVAAARSVDATRAWCRTLAPEVAARVDAIALDLNDPLAVDAAAARAGPVDILVLNGGGPPPGPAADVASDAWQQHFRTMAVHPFRLAQLLLPGMRERRWGRIVGIASSGVEQPIPNLAISNAVRAAVLGWAKTLASEVAADGVTVNLVLPGRIHTDRVDQLDAAAASRSGQNVEQVARASMASIPAGRYGRPEEFADTVAFIASERASYITGATIRCDGGMIRSV